MDLAVGVIEATSGAEMHWYLTSNAHAVVACGVASAALGMAAPLPGQLPAAVHCIHCDVPCGLTVYPRGDVP